MSLLFETVLIKQCIPVNLSYHENRFNYSRLHFWNAIPLRLGEYIKTSELDMGKEYRCRIDYNSEIESIKILRYQPVQPRSLQMITSDDIEYSFKFSDRTRLEQLFALRGSADDILIIKGGNVTDTSFANIVFDTGRNLITPSSFLLKELKGAALLTRVLSKKRI